MFRVAEFKRAKKGQIFKGFAYTGYLLTQKGELKHRRKKTTKDKRKNGYVELNRGLEQKDIKGVAIFENDIVIEHKSNRQGVIKYSKLYGGFFMIVNAYKIKIPYVLMNSRDYNFEVIGDIYNDKS